MDVARGIGSETFDRTKSATGKLLGGLAERALRLRGHQADGTETD
jgi:hypothetical protein